MDFECDNITIIDKNREITDKNDYDISNLDYFRVIQYVAYLNGFDITLMEADEIWREWSDEHGASFSFYDLTNTDSLWLEIQPYFPESTKKPDYDNIKFEYDIKFGIMKHFTYEEDRFSEYKRCMSYRIAETDKAFDDLDYKVFNNISHVLIVNGVNGIPIKIAEEVWLEFRSIEFNYICRTGPIDKIWDIVKDGKWREIKF